MKEINENKRVVEEKNGIKGEWKKNGIKEKNK